MLSKDQLIEERGEDPNEPIIEFAYKAKESPRDVFFPAYIETPRGYENTLSYWAEQARDFSTPLLDFIKRHWPMFGATTIGLSMVIPAIPSILDTMPYSTVYATGDCDTSHFLTSTDGSNLAVATQCEGVIAPLLPLTVNQEKARTRGNNLTTQLGHGDATGWLNFPAEAFPLDRISGGRLVADDYMTDILSGNPVMPEILANWTAKAKERITALQLGLNTLSSKLWNAPVTVNFESIRDIYVKDTDQPNKISDITVDFLRKIGVSDDQIFGENARIEFDGNGNPVAVWEWQTGLRNRVEDSPNTVIAHLKSDLGNYFVTVEEDDEGRISLSSDPEAFTKHGVRSSSVNIGIKVLSVNEDPNYLAVVIIDRSCGNIIAEYTVPKGMLETIEELIATVTPTPTETPSSPPPGGPGPGGPTPEETPVLLPTVVPTTVRPPSTPQPTSAIPSSTPVPPTAVPPTPIRPPSTAQPTSAIPAPTTPPVATVRPPSTPRPVSTPGS